MMEHTHIYRIYFNKIYLLKKLIPGNMQLCTGVYRRKPSTCVVGCWSFTSWQHLVISARVLTYGGVCSWQLYSVVLLNHIIMTVMIMRLSGILSHKHTCTVAHQARCPNQSNAGLACGRWGVHSPLESNQWFKNIYLSLPSQAFAIIRTSQCPILWL